MNFFDSVLKIDDPVGAISVHGVCGAAGTLLTGLLAVDGGVFYGGGFHFFGVQCLGVAATAVWTIVTITIVFQVLKHTIGLRVSPEEEVKGLDITEHGLPTAYGGFAFAYDDTPDGAAVLNPAAPAAAPIPVQEAVPVEVVTAPADAVSASPGVKMTKVDILCKMERFDALKRAMFDIGITGMTAINVMGCGEQRGKTEGYFRGARVEATMLPSIQVSIVVCRLPVRLVVETAKKFCTPAISATARSLSTTWRTSSKSEPEKRDTAHSRMRNKHLFSPHGFITARRSVSPGHTA